MPVRVAGIVFLVLGLINCFPILAALAMGAVEEGKSYLEDRRLLATVPERAEFAGVEPIRDINGEEISSGSYVSYKGNKYVCVHLVPVMERLEISEKKAYVESGGHLLENCPLYELKTDTGYDLILVEDDTSWDQDWLYCRREQEDDFLAECRGSIKEYQLYDEDDEDDGFPEEAGRKVPAEEFGITDEFLERFLFGDERIPKEDSEEDSEEQYYDYSYNLYASEMDGRFLEYGLSIYGPTDEEKWLCDSCYFWGRWQDEMGVDGGEPCYASKKMQEYMEAFVEEG